MKVVSRTQDRTVLEQFYCEKKAKFLVIYGRYGIGKTHFVDDFFLSKKMNFLKVTGDRSKNLSAKTWLFIKKINENFKDEDSFDVEPVKNWQQAFKVFTRTMQRVSKNKKTILFFDELPWLHTKNSDLLPALEYFWSQYWSKDKRIKLIISGSDGAWILDKIINNKKGLTKHISHIIALESFNLKETRNFIKLKKNATANLTLTNNSAEIYMAFGGIPQYLSQLPKAETATQVIQKSAFTRKSWVLDEFENLLASLFDNSKVYLQILKTIAANPFGISQEMIFKKLPKVSKGIGGLSKLRALEEAGLIRSFKPIFHNRKGIFYKIGDAFTLFCLYWLEPIKKQLLTNNLRKNYWQNLQATPKWRQWATQAFALICHNHVNQIATALNLSVDAIPSSWRYAPAKIEQEGQIDLLFDCDDAIVICELQYAQKRICIDKEYGERLQKKIAIFKKITKTKKRILVAMITLKGIKKTIYSEEMLMGVVTLPDFFKNI